MFLEIFLKYMYRYTGKSGITIFQFNDIILTSSWHIVKPGFHCSLFLVRNWGGGGSYMYVEGGVTALRKSSRIFIVKTWQVWCIIPVAH